MTRSRRSWGHIRRLPSKHYQASYIGRDLQRHVSPVTFTTKMDGEGWLHAERRLYESTEWTPPALRAAAAAAVTVTFETYAATWLAQRELKPRTRKLYDDLLRLHLNPTLGRIPVDHVTPAAVRGWYAQMNPDTPTVRAHAYGLLHAIAATLVKDEFLRSNPCAIAKAMQSTRKREPIVPTIKELHQIAEKIVPQRFKALILISAWCGLRWGEVIELRRGDISADGSVIRIGRAVTHVAGRSAQGRCVVSTPKSGKARSVVTPPHIRSAIADHLAQHVGAGADALLWPAVSRGCHLSVTPVRDYLAPALAAVGRTEMTVHDLRHFAGQQAARVGSLPEVMARLGHSTAKASLMYQSVAADRDVAIANALSELAAQ